MTEPRESVKVSDESDKKGFGGLSFLASEVEEEVLPKKPGGPVTKHKPAPRPEPEPEKVASAPNEGVSTQTAAPTPKPPSPPVIR